MKIMFCNNSPTRARIDKIRAHRSAIKYYLMCGTAVMKVRGIGDRQRAFNGHCRLHTPAGPPDARTTTFIFVILIFQPDLIAM